MYIPNDENMAKCDICGCLYDTSYYPSHAYWHAEQDQKWADLEERWKKLNQRLSGRNI